MMTRILILCSCLISTYTLGGFFNFDTDTPIPTMGVAGSSGEQTTTLEKARSSILAHQSQLNLDNNETLSFQTTSTDRFGNQHLRFNVAYQGIEVEKTQLIVHFDQATVRNISGYQQLLSASLKNKIDAHLKQGKTQLSADEVLAFINPKQHKVLSNKPLIVADKPYVIWQVRLLVNGLPTVYRISDSTSPIVLSTTLDIKY